MATLPSIPLFQRAAEHAERTAVVAGDVSWSYSRVLHEADALSSRLQSKLGTADKGGLDGRRVAILTPSDHHYVASQWGIWHAGGVAVPLYNKHPKPEMEYYVRDSGASAIVAHPSYGDTARQLADEAGIPLIDLQLPDSFKDPLEDPQQAWKSADSASYVDASNNALIIYTSGTTGKPKGVVSTHNTIEAQIRSLVEAWEWSASDRILHFLPLHHVHGVVNKLLCALWSGATVEFSLSGASPFVLWKRLGELSAPELSLFMAVPTVYSRLLEGFESLNDDEKKAALQGVANLRLMVSGSAACPAPLMERWERLTGHKLLERYGMTEIGMALSNPYRGDRQPGMVGTPLPGVEVRVVDVDTEKELKRESGEQGELRVRGPCVFKEYWGKPEATAKEFDEEGWFKTGDIVRFDPEKNSFGISGRASSDIIKSGGYKISALDIEREILSHESVAEVAVLGETDETWGESVVAVIRWKDSQNAPSLADFQDFLKPKLATYKVPRKVYSVEEIPKNAMGKVNKKTLLSQI
eukprot:CAMPEP_0197520502 /NCGR_PEP_ID=MMETSP1318-20131121/5857_1 /TAXON_ID=552666 /ORGANISM="Partenskyella glossopodia, Strain RCC365" /LENGTH=525 /DNA_ID=CAMNT_0043072111 /DNA_START=274 /DNA_END=1851 /DNA_ORIENTATION=+